MSISINDNTMKYRINFIMYELCKPQNLWVGFVIGCTACGNSLIIGLIAEQSIIRGRTATEIVIENNYFFRFFN